VNRWSDRWYIWLLWGIALIAVLTVDFLINFKATP
jgi:hypothetical protein